MEQTRSLNALEPYIALSKNARTPAAAAELITNATSDPSTYTFVELLQTPNIQSLASDSTHAPYLDLLKIFAWGTWTDYKASLNLPKLTARQTHKLKILSLLTHLSNPAEGATSGGGQNLGYDHLQKKLEIESQADLEQLLTTALSSGLVTGSLDPFNKLASISSTAPLRDLPPGSAPVLINTLSEWEGRCDTTLQELDKRVADIRSNAKKRGELEKKRKKEFEAKVEGDGDEEEWKVKKNGGNTGGNGKRKDVEYVDEAAAKRSALKISKRLFGGKGGR